MRILAIIALLICGHDGGEFPLYVRAPDGSSRMIEVPDTATLQTVQSAIAAAEGLDVDQVTVHVQGLEDLSPDQALSNIGVVAESTVHFEVGPHPVTVHYRELIERTNITLGDILRTFPKDDEDTCYVRVWAPMRGSATPVSTNLLSDSGRGTFSYWPRNQLTHYGHYLMFKVEEKGMFSSWRPKLLYFLFDQEGRLMEYKLYDRTTWRSSRRSSDTTLNLIHDLFLREEVTFNFYSSIEGDGERRPHDYHQETVKRVGAD